RPKESVPSFMRQTTASLLKRGSFNDRPDTAWKRGEPRKPRRYAIRRRPLRGFAITRDGKRLIRRSVEEKRRRQRARRARMGKKLEPKSPWEMGAARFRKEGKEVFRVASSPYRVRSLRSARKRKAEGGAAEGALASRTERSRAESVRSQRSRGAIVASSVKNGKREGGAARLGRSVSAVSPSKHLAPAMGKNGKVLRAYQSSVGPVRQQNGMDVGKQKRGLAATQPTAKEGLEAVGADGPDWVIHCVRQSQPAVEFVNRSVPFAAPTPLEVRDASSNKGSERSVQEGSQTAALAANLILLDDVEPQHPGSVSEGAATKGSDAHPGSVGYLERGFAQASFSRAGSPSLADEHTDGPVEANSFVSDMQVRREEHDLEADGGACIILGEKENKAGKGKSNLGGLFPVNNGEEEMKMADATEETSSEEQVVSALDRNSSPVSWSESPNSAASMPNSPFGAVAPDVPDMDDEKTTPRTRMRLRRQRRENRLARISELAPLCQVPADHQVNGAVPGRLAPVAEISEVTEEVAEAQAKEVIPVIAPREGRALNKSPKGRSTARHKHCFVTAGAAAVVGFFFGQTDKLEGRMEDEVHIGRMSVEEGGHTQLHDWMWHSAS
ncbi:unnamed protein product, partial [Ostreobium quekettii]